MDNTPHIMKLSNQASLDSILPSSRVSSRRGSSSSHEITNKKCSGGSSRGRYTAPIDSFIPHDLHNAKRAPHSYLSDDSLFTDSDSCTSTSSGDGVTDGEDVYLNSSTDSSPNTYSRLGKVGSISIHCRRKSRRKRSREQRKSLMQQMHVARCKKDKMGKAYNTWCMHRMSLLHYVYDKDYKPPQVHYVVLVKNLLPDCLMNTNW